MIAKHARGAEECEQFVGDVGLHVPLGSDLRDGLLPLGIRTRGPFRLEIETGGELQGLLDRGQPEAKGVLGILLVAPPNQIDGCLVRGWDDPALHLVEFCRGERNVVFPLGTYLMRVRFGVSCASS